MSILRIPIISDNTISQWSINPTLTGFGNAGDSQIVDVWNWYNPNTAKNYLTRILSKINVTAIVDAVNTGTIPAITDPTLSCNLKFYNINHSSSQAFDFTLQLFPVTKQWTEGRGTKIDSFTNTGYSSWVSAAATASWTNSGGDYLIDSNSASQYFDSGYEDLNVNIKNMVLNWVSGASSNFGFIVRLDPIGEMTGVSNQYFRKSFHGRTTNDVRLAPYLEIGWTSDQITDDRKIAKLGQNVNLCLFNSINSNYLDIDSITSVFPGSVTIIGTSGTATAASTLIQSLTASRIRKGVYKTSFTMPASASLFSNIRDVWTITSSTSSITPSITSSITTISSTSDDGFIDLGTFLNIIDFRKEISKEDSVTRRLFIVKQPSSLVPLVQSEKNSISSVASSTIDNFISTSGWWRVVSPDTGRVEIDWQPLDYDQYGNFFTLLGQNLARRVIFSLEFKIIERGQILIFKSKDYNFTVE